MSKKITEKTEIFFQKYPKSIYNKGQIIIKPGENPKSIYFLKKGLVRQYLKSPKGEILVIQIFRPGSFFLMTWILDNPVVTSYLEAVGKVEIYPAPITAVRDFIKKDPEVLYDFTLRLLKGVKGLVNRLEYLIFDEAYIRVAALVSYIAKTHGAQDQGNIVVNIPLTHREIAAWTGITRETASLQVEELKEKGLISYRGRQMIIKCMRSLEEEIASQKTLNV